jgi:spore germination protein
MNMDIYVVQPGDTIYSIADRYGVDVAKLVKDNELSNPDRLVPGETIVITNPTKIYLVQDGDTIDEIAASNDTTVGELLRNNPFISEDEFIYPGEVLNISFERSGSVTTHGYTNPFIDRSTLVKTLPYLSYLTILNYRTTKNGEVIAYEDDTELLQLSKDYGVIPLMLMTTLTVQGEVDLEITYEVLINEQSQNRLFDNVLRIVRERGYYGVNISAQYLTEANQSVFYNYILNLSNRLHAEGYLSVITVNPRIENSNGGISFEQIDYSTIGEIVDAILFLQYKWGFNYGPPSPVSSVYNLNVFLDYTLPQVTADKIYAGIPTLGYDWELPYAPGFSKASSLTLSSVMDLARTYNVTIEFDERSQTPYFQYRNVDNTPHEVRFVNATTINSLLLMLQEKGITGTGIWNIMNYFTQMWLVINCQYNINKLLPEQ